jgi:diguanylate cyclase (GGDEF)-like protein
MAVAMKKLVSLALSGSFALVVLTSTRRLSPLFSSDYLPHRYCYLADPRLVWTNVITDGLIALSYAVIFGSLLWIFSRLRGTPRLIPYLWILLSFGAFIVACGATHVMEVITVWWPLYPLSAAVKVICALASIPTAIIFAYTAPQLAKSLIHFLAVDEELQIANMELLDLSIRDPLTHLSNRRRFEITLSSEWQRSTRCTCPIAVLMMDLDHFKGLNDRYGHLAGDDCLRRIGDAFLARKGRAEDVIARYGGEEFALLLPGSDLTSAERIGEELRRAVIDLQIEHQDSPTASVVTMSIGVASRVPKHGDDPRELLAAADAALYRAKHNGRNRVESDQDLTATNLSPTYPKLRMTEHRRVD